MDCPQCGGTLDTYTLDGREAFICEDCSYVGIPAEHRGEPTRDESWDEALRRFYRARGADGDPRVEVQPPMSRPSATGESESWDEALRRFRTRREGGEDADATEETDEPGDATDGDPAGDADDAGDPSAAGS